MTSVSPIEGWEVKVTEAGTRVRFPGDQVRFDGQTSEGFADRLEALAEGLGRERLILDFGNVEYVTGTALARLILLHQRLQASGGWLTLTNVTPLVYEVFEITRLTRYLDVRPAGAPSADRWPGVAEPVII